MERSWNNIPAFDQIIYQAPACLLLLLLLLLFYLHNRKSSGHGRLPPGPPGWPILGNLFDLGTMPHRSLAGLRHKYGDVILLRLGAINTMVILSSRASTEFFKNHDMSFVERTITETSRALDYDKGSLALAPYGSYWRVLRRLVTVDMLVAKRINETAFVRRKCVDTMLSWIEQEEGGGGNYKGVHIARFVFLMSFNLLGNLMLSRDLLDPNSEDGSEFFEAMKRLMEWGGHANLADFFPWLRWLDPQGLRRKMERDLGKAMEIASKFVKERKNEQVNRDKERRKDFLDVLLEFEGNGKDEPANISDRDLNIFILEIFLAGSETTSSTIEWALTELLLHPEAMAMAKAELTRVIGPNRKLEENDIENLPYLQAIIKETLRLHPPIPFLVPRRAVNDTVFMGYFIPKNTQVFVNAWAIGRDPDVWNDPSFFKPERFIESKTDYKGQHFELIPFGAGRRMCAGVPLAHRVLHLVLGSLLHHFDWRLDETSVTRETMDMKDRLGITIRKFEPLLAIPTKCTSN
ncbi:Cytochrome P450, E-class, group I [Parasponia andersonii]|uniref:Cytochrome P450, E-class, group I n=1 Tax=Parasponia andersonii TaxID=3476 RepID=A0A2P5C4X3_PARAD|nr:Cytochrome P450, E-class, group I [Parasponia andersonii]